MQTKQILGISFNRVSSKEQNDGYSLSSQTKTNKSYANKNNFIIDKSFAIPESASGRKQRKIFKEMMGYVKKKDIKIIICEKVDRLTRNFNDAVAINNWLEEDPDRQVHLVKDCLILHKNARSQEKLNWNIRVAFAQNFIDNLSEEVKKGQKEKLEQGWLPLRPPLGYKSNGEVRHTKQIIDNKKAPLIKKMFELYATGNYSVKALTEKMKSEGLRNDSNNPVSKTRIHQLLSTHYYYGVIEWMGKLYKGNHDPIISKELFDEVQNRLSIKFGGKPKYRKHLFLFTGKIKCEECGGMVGWELHKGQIYGHCNHYRKCSQKIWVKQYEIEEQLSHHLNMIIPDERMLLILEEALRDSHDDEIKYNASKKEELNKIITIADQRIEGSYRDKLDGRMPITICEKIIEQSIKEKEDAINSLEKLNKSRADYYQAGYSIHELSLHIKDIFENEKVAIEDKRLLLSMAFSNLALNEGKIVVKYTSAFEFLAKWIPMVNSTFELLKMPNFTHKTEVLSSVCAQKCPKRGQGDLNP